MAAKQIVTPTRLILVVIQVSFIPNQSHGRKTSCDTNMVNFAFVSIYIYTYHIYTYIYIHIYISYIYTYITLCTHYSLFSWFFIKRHQVNPINAKHLITLHISDVYISINWLFMVSLFYTFTQYPRKLSQPFSTKPGNISHVHHVLWFMSV